MIRRFGSASLILVAIVALAACQRQAAADTPNPALNYARAARLAADLPTLAHATAMTDTDGAMATELKETRADIDEQLSSAAGTGPADDRVSASWKSIGTALDVIVAN